MKKFLLLIPALLVLAGCNFISTNKNQATTPQNSNSTQATISYIVSPDQYTKYCNGADMDSEGYRNSLTIKKSVPENKKLSLLEQIKESVALASDSATLMTAIYNQPDFMKISGDTAYIMPVEGWAGVSIFLCAWQPLVEKNILQYSEIKNVVWTNSQQQWDSIK